MRARETNFKSYKFHKMNLMHDDFFSIPVKFEIYQFRAPIRTFSFLLRYFIKLITSIALDKCIKKCDMD